MRHSKKSRLLILTECVKLQLPYIFTLRYVTCRYCTYLLFQVKFSVFLSYLRSIGVCAVVFTVIFLLLTEICHVTAGFWLASWSAANITSHKQRDFYIIVYGGIGLGHGLFNFLLAVTLCFGSMAASRRYCALFFSLPFIMLSLAAESESS